MKVTKIEWLDANTIYGGWTAFEALEGHHLATVETAGFIHDENSDFITIIQSHTDNDDFMAAISVPKSCIVSRQDY